MENVKRSAVQANYIDLSQSFNVVSFTSCLKIHPCETLPVTQHTSTLVHSAAVWERLFRGDTRRNFKRYWQLASMTMISELCRLFKSLEHISTDVKQGEVTSENSYCEACLGFPVRRGETVILNTLVKSVSKTRFSSDIKTCSSLSQKTRIVSMDTDRHVQAISCPVRKLVSGPHSTYI